MSIGGGVVAMGGATMGIGYV